MIWTFRDIMGAIIMGLFVLGIVIATVYHIILYIVHMLFYKPCKKCKYCKLTNVASCGNGRDYKCTYGGGNERLADRMIGSQEDVWHKCNHFEKL